MANLLFTTKIHFILFIYTKNYKDKQKVLTEMKILKL